jgi:hypothetical protein
MGNKISIAGMDIPSDISEEDLVRLYQKKMDDAAIRAKGGLRAVGEGATGNFWDEIEGRLRSLGTNQDPRNFRDKVRAEQEAYAQKYPAESTALEFVGGALPMAISGGASAPAQGAGILTRMAANPYARNMVIGGAQGVVSGAGSAQEMSDAPQRMLNEGLFGAASGVAIPAAGRLASGALSMLKNKFSPDSSKLATEMLSKAANKAGVDTETLRRQMEAKLVEDRLMGVDQSTMMDLHPEMEALGRQLAGGSKRGREIVAQKALQDIGSESGRAKASLKVNLSAGEYYPELNQFIETRKKVGPEIYEKIRQFGDVDDNVIADQLQNSPSLKGVFNEIQKINKDRALTARGRGEDPTPYEMKDIYRSVTDKDGNIVDYELTKMPDFKTLDLLKQSLDGRIRSEFISGNKENAVNLREKRDLLLSRMEKIAPEYKALRTQYGDMKEIEEAAEIGRKEIGGMDHEVIQMLYNDMSDPAKHMFRTGAGRYYAQKISDAAERTGGPAEVMSQEATRERLLPLFDGSEAKLNLFNTGMQRHTELNEKARERLAIAAKSKDKDGGLDGATRKAVMSALTGPKAAVKSLVNDIMIASENPKMTDEVAEKLNAYLSANDPAGIAGAIKAIEMFKAEAQAAAKETSRREGMIVSGVNAAIPKPEHVKEGEE